MSAFRAAGLSPLRAAAPRRTARRSCVTRAGTARIKVRACRAGAQLL